jgi:hypothetical protein
MGVTVANLDREPLGRADGARLYCHCCEDFARCLDRGRRQAGSDRAKVLEVPPPLFRRAPRIRVPFTLVALTTPVHEGLPDQQKQRAMITSERPWK